MVKFCSLKDPILLVYLTHYSRDTAEAVWKTLKLGEIKNHLFEIDDLISGLGQLIKISHEVCTKVCQALIFDPDVKSQVVQAMLSDSSR